MDVGIIEACECVVFYYDESGDFICCKEAAFALLYLPFKTGKEAFEGSICLGMGGGNVESSYRRGVCRKF